MTFNTNGGFNMAAPMPFTIPTMIDTAPPPQHYVPPSQQQSGVFLIERVVMVKQPSFGQQYLRPYSPQVDYNTTAGIQESLARTGANGISGAILQQFSGRLLAPSARPVGEAQMVNGWNVQRYAFTLIMRFTNNMGMLVRYYVCGFTEHSEVEMNGAVNPEAVFHVNSITKARLRQSMNGQMEELPSEASHAISSANMGISTIGDTGILTMLPNEVVSTMTIDLMAGQHRGRTGQAPTVYNGVQALTSSDTKMSRFGNASPTDYATKTLNAFITAHKDGGGDHMSYPDLVGNAANQLPEALVSQDPFTRELIRFGNSNFCCTMFRFGNLGQLDNTFNTRGRDSRLIIPSQNVVIPPTMAPGNEGQWAAMTPSTVAATTIAHSLPYIMVLSRMAHISFRASNMYNDPNLRFQTWAGQPISPAINPAEAVGDFQRHWFSQIEPEITQGMNIPYAIECNVFPAGSMDLKLSVNGSPMTPYPFPAFASSQLLPVISNSQTQTGQIVSAFGGLYEAMNEAMNIGQGNSQVFSSANGAI